MSKNTFSISKQQAQQANATAHINDLANGGNTKIAGIWQQPINKMYIQAQVTPKRT